MNGSFEEGPFVPSFPGWVHLDPGSTAITGWVVTRDQIEYIGAHYDASDGEHSLDLNGTPGAGGVAQVITTVPGRAYTVFFDLAGNPFGEPDLKTLRVEVDGGAQAADYSFDISQHSGMGWERESFHFIATQSATTLELYSTTPIGDYGPALDNVRIFEGGCGEPVRHCTSLPNSAGTSAWIDFLGTGDVDINDAELVAQGCTPGSFGIFIYGAQPVEYPFGSGLLCINPFAGLYRLPPAGLTDDNGACNLELDFKAMPPGSPLLGGSAWSFQFLYRDTGGPSPTFNSTDAIRVLLC